MTPSEILSAFRRRLPRHRLLRDRAGPEYAGRRRSPLEDRATSDRARTTGLVSKYTRSKRSTPISFAICSAPSNQPVRCIARVTIIRSRRRASTGANGPPSEFCQNSVGQSGTANRIITGDIASIAAGLVCIEEGDPSLVFHYFGDTKIPAIENQYSFTAAGCEFIIRKRDTEFVVEARGPGALADRFHVRVQEALRLLLAQSVDWRALLRHDALRQRLELASGTQRAHRAQLGRPVDGDYGCIEDCWRLFGRYLEYVLGTVPASSWNRCSYYLYNACEASTSSVDAWAIGVSVAVEGIASLIKSDLPPEEKTKLAWSDEVGAGAYWRATLPGGIRGPCQRPARDHAECAPAGPAAATDRPGLRESSISKSLVGVAEQTCPPG